MVVGPQWSPDGRRIAFFATTGRAGAYEAYVMDADGGPPLRLTRSEGELEALPAWSRDGRSIYLTSSRSGSLQIWRMPVAGGESVQLTKRGGAEAVESPDGRVIYYTKVPEVGPGSGAYLLTVVKRNAFWSLCGSATGLSRAVAFTSSTSTCRAKPHGP